MILTPPMSFLRIEDDWREVEYEKAAVLYRKLRRCLSVVIAGQSLCRVGRRRIRWDPKGRRPTFEEFLIAYRIKTI